MPKYSSIGDMSPDIPVFVDYMWMTLILAFLCPIVDGAKLQEPAFRAVSMVLSTPDFVLREVIMFMKPLSQ